MLYLNVNMSIILFGSVYCH